MSHSSFLWVCFERQTFSVFGKNNWSWSWSIATEVVCYRSNLRHSPLAPKYPLILSQLRTRQRVTIFSTSNSIFGLGRCMNWNEPWFMTSPYMAWKAFPPLTLQICFHVSTFSPMSPTHLGFFYSSFSATFKLGGFPASCSKNTFDIFLGYYSYTIFYAHSSYVLP